jgi:hypothetical protein
MALPLLLNSKVGAGFVASSVGQISRPSKKCIKSISLIWMPDKP